MFTDNVALWNSPLVAGLSLSLRNVDSPVFPFKLSHLTTHSAMIIPLWSLMKITWLAQAFFKFIHVYRVSRQKFMKNGTNVLIHSDSGTNHLSCFFIVFFNSYFLVIFLTFWIADSLSCWFLAARCLSDRQCYGKSTYFNSNNKTAIIHINMSHSSEQLTDN